jgi:hypothetical protein
LIVISDWVIEVADCGKFLVDFVGSLLLRLRMPNGQLVFYGRMEEEGILEFWFCFCFSGLTNWNAILTVRENKSSSRRCFWFL